MPIPRLLIVLPLLAVAACSPEASLPAPVGPTAAVSVAPRAHLRVRLEATRSPGPASVDDSEPVAPVRAMELFARHCAPCHGDGGSGDGPAAPWLDPHPWNFAGGLFKFGTTGDGTPSDADLRRTIEHGLAGTPMPAFARLPSADLDELVRAVRHLSLVATAARIQTVDGERTRAEALAAAHILVAPGRPIELPPRPAGESTEPDTVYAYVQRCVECHGTDGSGRDAEDDDWRDFFKFEVRPRDLTREPLKGGTAAEDVARRIVRGIPGTPMPQSFLEAPALWAVVDQVMGMRASVPPEPPGPSTLVAARSSGLLPTTPDAPEWEFVAPVRWSLRPLRTHDAAPGDVEVRALHDGSRILFRVTWRSAAAAPAGAAIRIARAGDIGPAFTDDAASRANAGRWQSLTEDASATEPPACAPPSLWPEADRGFRASCATLDGATSVVFEGALPAVAIESGSMDVLVGAWSGVADDGRAREGVGDWQRVELGR